MHPDDAQYQRILWRILWRNIDGQIREYCLTTVTFGTASAPFTAIRVLHQLALDEKERFPLAENILRNDIYVDDILSGSDSFEMASLMRDQLTSALRSCGMELRKWASNTPELLRSIPAEHQMSGFSLQLNNNDNTTNATVKTLGLYWQPNSDAFTFSINFAINPAMTKRSVLSTIARLFDPLGFLSPVTVAAKIILKEIWTMKVQREDSQITALDWDEALPRSVGITWQHFVSELSQVNTISIPRWVCFSSQHVQSMELHAFCDGSSSAYAASVYLRVRLHNDDIQTYLVAAKTKVTPTCSITIPRVELCGAVLATTLANWVQKNLNGIHNKVPIFYWTDAMIVLYWIQGDINKWKTYVQNRISIILSTSTPNQWNHVRTNDNPADCATRGLTPKQLKNMELWWRGPEWLKRRNTTWKKYIISDMNIDRTATEERAGKVNVHATIIESSFLCRYSSYTKLLRITAWLFRFYIILKRSQRVTWKLAYMDLLLQLSSKKVYSLLSKLYNRMHLETKLS